MHGMCFTLCLLFLIFELSLSQCDRKFLQESVATYIKENNFTKGAYEDNIASLQAKNSSGALRMYTWFTEAHPGAFCMNWGISSGQDDGPLPDVPAGWMPTLEAYSLQLYHFIAESGLPKDALQNKTVLEVGCGRGRGAEYVARVFNTRRYVGMDLTQANVETARRAFGGHTGLEFMQGNALDIQLPAAQFDVVLNVESSHNYPDFDQFAAEVFRVLKPGGFFLWTDLLQDTTPSLRAQQVWNAGFHIRRLEDIHASVLRSRVKAAAEFSDDELQRFCDDIDDRKKESAGLSKNGPSFWELFALPGSMLFKALESEQLPYVHIVAQKSRFAVSNEDVGRDEL